MRPHHLLTLISVVLLSFGSMTAGAQQRPLTLEDALSGRLIRTRNAGSVQWLKDGERFMRLERNAATGGTDIVAYRAKDEAREVLIPSSLLQPTGSDKPLQVRSIAWSDDGKRVLIYTNTRRVWRYDSKGDYWVLSLADNSLRRLGRQFPPSTLMYAAFSPGDGAKVAYVQANNLYVEEVASGKVTPLTTDGSDRFVNGNFDWVYEEEFHCLSGFRWSPSGKYIAYWQSDTEGSRSFDIINNVDSLYPFVTHFPYPKAGQPNSAVRVGYVPVDGGTTTWIDLPGHPREHYIPRMEFIPDADELFIQQMNRQQNTNRVWVAALDGSAPKNIFTDTDKAWVETNDDIRWLDNNKWFTWESERSGWRHLYRVSRDGQQIVPITTGNFDYISSVAFDIKRKTVYFMASPDNYTQRYLYSAPLFGNGQAKRVSPATQAGQHGYSVSPTGAWAVHTFSNAATPPVADMITLPHHKVVRVMETNAEAKQQYADLHLRPKEFLQVDVNGYRLDVWMIKPHHFDPNKKYPLILDIYGEPASATVQDRWGNGDLWHQYLAGQGYIVASIDPRGTATPRGREWRKCIYGEVGTFASADMAGGVIELSKRFPFIDRSRIGITGWSGGGSQTLNCMFRYPDVFSTGIAVAFVADQKLYDTIYQERYMDTPQNNPEGYRKGSPITYADGLRGRLLLMHGTGDDNVHYQNCERLVNELIRHGKVFYQLSYPMRTHGISEGPGTSLHVRRSMADFWKNNL